MSKPCEAPLVSLVNPDGGWFCPDCCSLNRARSPRCYSCRAASPFVDSRISDHWGHKRLSAVLVAGLVVLGIGGSIFLGAAASPATSANALASLVATVPAGTDSPAPDLSPTPAPSDSPTAAPSFILSPTISPAPSEKTTLIPVNGNVSLPRFPVSIKGATIVWFGISGDNPGALIASDEAASSVACDMESLACFHDTYKWNSSRSVDPKSGVCKITSVNLNATYTITLPRWSAPAKVPAALVAWWKQVLAHFVWHESQHLAIARSYAASIKAAIMAGPCTNSGLAAAKAALARLAKAQDAFDAAQKTANWQWPSYTGPWN